MFGKTWIRCATAALATLPLLAAAAPPAIGLLTIADGDVTVLRDTERYAAAEGLRVRADDIVVTGEKTRLVRIELADGKVLDLGPGTQLMLQPRALARDAERAATVYLAAGWVKLAAPWNQTTPAMLAGPRLDAVRVGGTVIARAAPDLAWLFVETGVAEAVLHADGRRAAPLAMHDADSLLQRGAAAPESGRLPPAEMLAQMPRPFTDTLPRRSARFAEQAFDAAKGSPAGYAEVSPWLNGEPAIRSAFVPRFTPRARESAFRASLVADLRLHPEWRPVLFPPPPPKPRPAPVMPPAPETETVVKAPE